ncbi:uncharacterized protein LOC119076865 isoform X2 [Bradysia coprophila]|uniref:uncharacterized protein LOC119076865 isoform X2 n=1 Tax=Bradysia coprophila TaxID=38358 RepID=UPI00187D87F2|nr:uncharacterized protein LOC119076865 isoform X2 [Bradysia coprophila]
MKFIFVATIVSALALSLCSSSNVTGDYSPFYKSLVTRETYHHYANDSDPTDRIYFSTQFEHMLTEQYFQAQSFIVDAWMKCGKVFVMKNVDDAIDIFKNPPLGRRRVATSDMQCLYHCIMNRTGMTDDGFQEAPYMKLIKQLRFNYTSFDVDELRGKTKLKLLASIRSLANGLNNYKMITYQNAPHPDEAYYLIESYARAAYKCKDVDLGILNKCEDCWNVIRCILLQNRLTDFDSPFFPLWVK